MSDLTAELDKLINGYEETLNAWADIPVWSDTFKWTDESMAAAQTHDDATAALCRFVVQHKHELMDALAEHARLAAEHERLTALEPVDEPGGWLMFPQHPHYHLDLHESPVPFGATIEWSDTEASWTFEAYNYNNYHSTRGTGKDVEECKRRALAWLRAEGATIPADDAGPGGAAHADTER